jgi:ATP-dependent Clp protease protease subunit
MSLYEERPDTQKVEQVELLPDASYQQVSEQLATLMDFDDSVIYLTDDIDENTLIDFMIRVRSILKNRPAERQDDPINLIVNSNGGDIYEMLGLIDYIETLSVKVNTICRGKAFSAAAIILACGTGTRMVSKRSSVMFHQSSSLLDGKMSDLQSYLDNVKMLEGTVYELLAEKTKKDAKWWKDHMKSDFFIPADKLVEYGVIDQVI